MNERRARLGIDGGFGHGVQDLREQNTVLVAPFQASLDEIERAYAFNPHRAALFAKFRAYCTQLQATGCRPLLTIIGGSFLDEVEEPGDIDIAHILCGVPTEAIPLLLDKEFIRKRFIMDVMAVTVEKLGMRQALQIMRVANYLSCRRDGKHRSTIALIYPENGPLPSSEIAG